MKKKLFLFLLMFMPLLFISCGDDEPDSTTYTVNYTLDDSSGSTTIYVDLTLFEYNEANERISTNSMSKVKKGTTKTFTASERAEKVKVYMKMYAESVDVSSYKWVQTVFYLKKGQNTQISIGNSTMVGNYEP